MCFFSFLRQRQKHVMSVEHGNRIRQRVTRNVFSAKVRRPMKFDRFTTNLFYYTRSESSYFYITPPSPSEPPSFPVTYAASPDTLRSPYICTRKKNGTNHFSSNKTV